MLLESALYIGLLHNARSGCGKSPNILQLVSNYRNYLGAYFGAVLSLFISSVLGKFYAVNFIISFLSFFLSFILYLSIYLLIYWLICLFIYLFIHLFIYLLICLVSSYFTDIFFLRKYFLSTPLTYFVVSSIYDF